LRAENWHRSLLMKMTRSRILQTWFPVNPWKKELIKQNRNFLATSANNLVTGLQNALKSSTLQGTEVIVQLLRRILLRS
jgi:hypothetical protein